MAQFPVPRKIGVNSHTPFPEARVGMVKRHENGLISVRVVISPMLPLPSAQYPGLALWHLYYPWVMCHIVVVHLHLIFFRP